MSRYVHGYGGLTGTYVFMRAVLPVPEPHRAWPAGSSEQILLRRHTSDVAAFEQIFIEGKYDFSFQDCTPKFIVDGGANIGCASVFFAQKFPQASVLAIEPELCNFAILQHNPRRFTDISAMRGENTVLIRQ